MRRILLLTVGALLLGLLASTAAPTFAQTATPQITTPVVRDLTEATNTLGILTVVILFVLGVLALIVVFFVVGALRLAVPLVTTVQKLLSDLRDERQARLKAEEQRDEDRDESDQVVAELREKQAKHLSEMAGSLLRLGNILSDTETKKESQERGQREVEAITEHVTHDGDETRKALREVADKVEEINAAVNKAATVDALDGALEPLREQVARMNETLAQVIRRIGTDELKPAPSPLPTPPPVSSAE